MNVHDNISELYYEYLEIFFDLYMTLSDAQKKDLGNNYNPINLFLETCNYDSWFENKELYDTTTTESDKEESI